MLFAKIQTASKFSAIGLTPANIRKPAVDEVFAFRMVADAGYAVADVSLPFFVVAD